jgi:hypothetical protein
LTIITEFYSGLIGFFGGGFSTSGGGLSFPNKDI